MSTHLRDVFAGIEAMRRLPLDSIGDAVRRMSEMSSRVTTLSAASEALANGAAARIRNVFGEIDVTSLPDVHAQLRMVDFAALTDAWTGAGELAAAARPELSALTNWTNFDAIQPAAVRMAAALQSHADSLANINVEWHQAGLWNSAAFRKVFALPDPTRIWPQVQTLDVSAIRFEFDTAFARLQEVASLLEASRTKVGPDEQVEESTLQQWLDAVPEGVFQALGLRWPVKTHHDLRVMLVTLLVILLMHLEFAYRTALALADTAKGSPAQVRALLDELGSVLEAKAEVTTLTTRAPRYRVNADSALRGGPSAKSSRVARLESGQVVTLVASDGRWRLIELEGVRGVRGWIYRRSLDYIEDHRPGGGRSR